MKEVGAQSFVSYHQPTSTPSEQNQRSALDLINSPDSPGCWTPGDRDQAPPMRTMALGEDGGRIPPDGGGCWEPPPARTMAVGEEGGRIPPSNGQDLATTLKNINRENELRQIQIQRITHEGNKQKQVHDAAMALLANSK